MARAGLNRKSALATTTLVIAAEAPDVDAIANVRGAVAGFAHHRGITHTFIGVPLVAAGVVLFVYLMYRLRLRYRPAVRASTPRWGTLFWLACLAGLSHIALDFTNNYGVRPFEPFSYKWYAWDIVFIVEPVLLLILLAGLLLPGFFRLINEEIGPRQRGPHGRGAAILALIGMVVVWGVRDFEHRSAVAALESQLYDGSAPVRVSAFPYWVNPFKWYGVVETPNSYRRMLVDSSTPEVDPAGQAEVQYKPEETPVTLAAKGSYLGRVYLDWARYPIVESQQLEPPGSGYVVIFHDVRYMYPGQLRATLTARVYLDDKLNVVEQKWGLH
jgi:inner membrane protein